MRSRLWMGVLLGSLALGACSDGLGTEPELPELAADEAEAELLDMLYWTIQDEFHAENVYLRVLADHGEVMPFKNIVRAEDFHSTAIARLYEARSIAVPATTWNLDNVPTFATLQAACQGAYQAEIDNIAVYDRYMDMDLPADVRTVFTSNRAASLDRHMPAFLNCS